MYCDRDETVNNKQVQQTSIKKYKSKHDGVREVNCWELCKKLKFEYTDKWYLHKPESILLNETHGSLIYKRITQCRSENQTYLAKSWYLAHNGGKMKENEKLEKYMDVARERKNSET